MVVSFVRASQEVLLVVTDEPTSITDAYGLIKLLNQEHALFRFNVVTNMVKSAQNGQQLFSKLTKVTDRFLDIAMQYVGFIPWDESIKKAVQRQQPLLEIYPRSQAAHAFRNLARKVDTWPINCTPRGNLQFFIEHLLLMDAKA
jgi:flagellar biosynthesis protein FlhG